MEPCPECGCAIPPEMVAGEPVKNHFTGCPSFERWEDALRAAGHTHYWKVIPAEPSNEPAHSGALTESERR